MADHYLTIMANGEANYAFRVDGEVHPVTTGLSVLRAEEDIFDNITQGPDGTFHVEGRTGAIAEPGSAFYGDTYRFNGKILEANLSVSTGTEWTYLLDGKEATKAELLAFEPDGEEPPTDGADPRNWFEKNPLLAGIMIGAITQAVLRAVGGD